MPYPKRLIPERRGTYEGEHGSPQATYLANSLFCCFSHDRTAVIVIDARSTTRSHSITNYKRGFGRHQNPLNM